LTVTGAAATLGRMTTFWIVPGNGDAGWEHGLPPSVTPAAWPRHKGNGLPLVHGFTIRVPEEYRVRGSDCAAFSYFHPGQSESYAPKPALRDRIQAVVAGGALEGPESDDPFFQALFEHVKTAQPNTQYFTDLLSHTHAIVWHTEAELERPRCARPEQKLPAGHEPKTMHLDEPVLAERGLSRAEQEPGRPFIQLGPPLHWVQSEVDGFGEKVLEIEDDVGRANYGGGNCQVDLANGLLDWAC
jgi:hypothetical protein